MSEVRKGKHPTEETRNKLREARKKRIFTEETRQKLRDNNAMKRPEVIEKFKGENSSNSKLTNIEAEEIRKKYTPYSYTMKTLAEEYGVSVSNIEKIIYNKSYLK